MSIKTRPAFLSAGLAILLTGTALTGCAASAAPEQTDAASATEVVTSQGLTLEIEPDDDIRALYPDSVLDSGKLRLAIDPSYPPSAFKDEEDQIIGLGPDLAAVVAAKAGLAIEWTEVPFDGMLGGLQAGRFDAAWAGFSVTPARLEVINMVTYIQGGSAVLVPAGNPDNLSDIDDLCGLVIGVQKGTIQAQDVMTVLQENCAAKDLDPVEPLELPLQTDVAQAIDAGRAAAALGDGINISYLALEESDRFDVAEGILILPVNAAIAVPLDQIDVAEALQATFNAMIADGTYAEIMDSWNLTNSAVTESMLNPKE